MVTGRASQQVARRVVVLSTICFRASLEISDHHRASELSNRLLPWLIDSGCGNELDPIEHQLLATPIHELSDSQRVSANWAGEAAAFFCWMLQLREPLDEINLADQSNLPTLRTILQPEAVDLIACASLRAREEIEDTCRQYVLIRSMLQELRLSPPGTDILRRIHVQKLNQVNVPVSGHHIMRAAAVVSRMSVGERKNVAGMYFIRDHAGMWFLGDRNRYFEQPN